MNIVPIILTVLTIVMVVFSIGKPSRMLALYTITRPMIQPFIHLQYTFFVIPYSYIWAAILPLLYAINLLRGRWVLRCYRSGPLLIILALSVLSLAVSMDVRVSIDGIIKMLTGIFAYGAAYNIVKNTKAADALINSIILASIVPLLFGFYQAMTGNYSQIHESVTDRVNSVFGIGNAYGIFLTITMCAVMMGLLQRDLKKNTRLLYVGLLAAMITSQVLALNRGTWAALAIGIIVALVPYRRKVNIRWFVIGSIVTAIAFSGIIVKRFTESHVRWDGSTANTLAGRVDGWFYLIPEILDKPILGHGIGTTGVVGGTVPPHNDYIRFAMDIGVLGAFVYAYFLASLALFYMRRSRVNRGGDLWRYNFPMTVLTVYFIVISATQNITQSFINFGFFLILNGAVVRLNLQQPKTKVKGGLLRKSVSND